jgi:hypothetical protein
MAIPGCFLHLQIPRIKCKGYEVIDDKRSMGVEKKDTPSSSSDKQLVCDLHDQIGMMLGHSGGGGLKVTLGGKRWCLLVSQCTSHP